MKKILRYPGDISHILRTNRQDKTSKSKSSQTIRHLLYGYPKNFRQRFSLDDFSGFSDYVSEIERRRIARLNPHEIEKAFSDKLLFPTIFEADSRLICANLFSISAGKVNLIGAGNGQQDLESAIIHWPDKIVIKPRDGVSGAGVRIFDLKDGRLTDGVKTVEIRELGSIFEPPNEYIGCAFVRQHPTIAKLYPGSVNTIRVLTYFDEIQGKHRIADAVLRIGTDVSAPVDNGSAGGLSARIDQKEATLSRAAAWKLPAGSPPRRPDFCSRHPDSGEQIEGVKVPNWTKISEGVLSLCESLPGLKIAGWDIVVTDDETGFVVLEANSNPAMNVHQIHSGLLRNKDFRSFLGRSDVLMRRRVILERLARREPK